jgi:hypothetical protein
MASKKQVAANQQNAQKSTGPKNTENTRYNRCYHGLRGSRVVLSHESMDEYTAMAATYYAYFQPEGTVEHDLVKRIADRQWELARLTALKSRVAESATYRDTRDDELFKLERHESSIERSLIRIRRELTQLQILRGKFAETAPAVAQGKPYRNKKAFCGFPPQPKVVMLYENEHYMGPHHQDLYTQGEVAVDNLMARAVRELRRQSPSYGREGLQAAIRDMADRHLSSEDDQQIS